MTNVIGLGAGGHAKVVIEILQLIGSCDIVGLLDPKKELWSTKILGVPVLGNDDMLAGLRGQGVEHAFIGVGSTGDTQPRVRLFEKALQHGFALVSAIHPRAVVSASAELGRGSAIMANAVINAAAKLGDNVIVNTGAVVEHDCLIGSHVHIATGANIASTVQVGEGSHIGVGASVRQCVHIGRNSIVGAGAVVVEDVPDGVMVAGVPARILKKAE